MLLTDGLWQVAGPGITHAWDANAYLVTASRYALIDCGTGLASGELDAALAACGASIDRLAVVVATHGHFDHVGDGARLQAAGVPVVVHAGDAEAVRSADPVKTCAASLYGMPFEGFDPDGIGDGDRIDLGRAMLDVIHTPGHTPGSICVVATVMGLRVLLAGDTLWGGFSPAIGSDEAAWRSSLDRLCDLDVDLLTFGHGPARLLGDPAGRLAEARARFATYFDPWFRPPRLALRY